MSDRSPISDGNGTLSGCRVLLAYAVVSVLVLLVIAALGVIAVQAVA